MSETKSGNVTKSLGVNMNPGAQEVYSTGRLICKPLYFFYL